MGKIEKIKEMDTFLKTCYLEKPLHFEFLKLLKKRHEGEKNPITIGELVALKLGADHDGKMIVVAKIDNFVVGALTEEDAKDIRPYIQSGWDEDKLFTSQVNKYDESAAEDKMLSIAIYVKQFSKKIEPEDKIEDDNVVADATNK